MIFRYPYTDLYTLNLDWILQTIKELQDIVGTLGTVVNSFNSRVGDVTLQAADVNATMINTLWTSDPGETITDIPVTILDSMYENGIRIMVFLTEDGNPNTLFFLYWDEFTTHAVAQEYAPTGAIAGVASINGKTGVVTENAETLVMSSTDTTTIGNRIAALAASVNTNSNNIAAHSTSIAQQAQTLAQLDTTVTRIDNTVESVEGDIVALQRDKQNVLTFDSTPTHDSNNPVTSTGILAALNTLTEYVGAQLALKQNKLTFDNTPTADSANPVTSDGIKKAFDSLGSETEISAYGFYLYRFGRIRVLDINSTRVLTGGSTLIGTVPEGDRPIHNGVVVETVVYNGSSYVDCILSVERNGDVLLRSNLGQPIEGAQIAFIRTNYVIYYA